MIDVLVPTRNRPVELATTLAGLAAQTGVDFSLTISDQSDGDASWETPSAWTVIRWLRRRGVPVALHRHLPARGMAEQRAFLLSCASAPEVLYLDDDVWLEPGALARLHRALGELRCGMVGAAMQALGHAEDRRPHEVGSFSVWDGPVEPERLVKDGPGWDRWRLHNAANGLHLAEAVDVDGPGRAVPSSEVYVPYKVAWVAGCVLFDRARLVEAGGFEFWRDVPPDAHGEDVYSQQQVMARSGAAGILPGGAYHQESPTALPDRGVSAVDALAT
ncbi:glycosyl transferase family 2 [Actinomycetospora succinea]|uniref:Glycosyl transferase family 2 n=1 Tax=Actinomycetospora succinea TaxID=663603 RepID=A0A4R6UHU8_9PSEU|nr:glycosyltransferase family A protein [Actinomycetospora succinea]TDQ46428.1 glycosyl transferase family 2 [Actinomycetospora succinea]